MSRTRAALVTVAVRTLRSSEGTRQQTAREASDAVIDASDSYDFDDGEIDLIIEEARVRLDDEAADAE